MEKQQKILEMAKDICRVNHICNDVCHPISACDALKYAERAVEAGYVKQSEGEWIWINQAKGYLEPPYGDTCKCSLCEFEIDVSETHYKYCPYCGAKMKGGAQK